MRIGLLAYSSDTGLGNQTYSFYKHMCPVKTLLVDLSAFNKMATHHGRYSEGEVRITEGIPNVGDVEWLTDDVDAIFVCETPLNYLLFKTAKGKGIPTVLQYNYEFLDYMQDLSKPVPTVLAAPTNWNRVEVENLSIAPVIDLPVPVESVEARVIDECEVMFHIAGKQAIHDRNGTYDFIEAAIACGNKFDYIIYAQWLNDATKRFIEEAGQNIDLTVIYDTPDYQDMYKTGDVLVMPRKYGGLCLPMQEALAYGIPVIMPDIEPNGYRLHADWLVKAEKVRSFNARTEIDIHDVNIEDLAFKMLNFLDTDFMRWSNIEATQAGKELSWEKLKPYYQTILENL